MDVCQLGLARVVERRNAITPDHIQILIVTCLLFVIQLLIWALHEPILVGAGKVPAISFSLTGLRMGRIVIQEQPKNK